MKRFAALLLLPILLCGWLIGNPIASYTGPGNQATFTAWWGLRAYNTTIAAAGTQSVVDLRRASDNATCTAKVATDGSLDLTAGAKCNGNTQTVAAWANNASSCTAAITTTTMTVASCSAGNLTTGAPISGAAAGTIITALGTGTGGAGTYTVSPSQTLASGSPITAPIWTFVSKIYDQVAGNACGGASCDLVQATAGNQPKLFLSGGGGAGTKPYIHVIVQFSGKMEGANNFTPNAAKLISLSVVAIRDSGTSTSTLITSNNSSNNSFTAAAANVWGSNVNGTATDKVWHAANASKNEVVGGSTVNIDGVETTGTGTVTLTAGHPIILDTFSTAVGLGLGEAGFADNTNWSSGTRTALCHDQRLYWGTGGSC